MGPLLILGASARAAAASARRAGFSPYAGDLFADEDLRRLAPAVRVKDYPEGLATVARDAPPGPWMYTGGLENYPELVNRIARQRPLLGNPAEVLTAVRDPFHLAQAFGQAGVPFPPIVRSAADIAEPGHWLCKPFRGSGGTGISVWDPQASAVPEGTHYFQQWIGGEPQAAVYVAAAGQSALLGVTRQWLGPPGGAEFQYRGSLGPLRLSREARAQFQHIGRVLASTFSLAGIFGVDAIVADARVVPIEVNPRYTASVEVLEHGLEIDAVRMHADACRHGKLPPSLPEMPRRLCAKKILCANADVTVPASLPSLPVCCPTQGPSSWLADVPAVGLTIRAGQPVLTVLATGAAEESLGAALDERMRQVERLLYPG